jgi:HNH endonuclease
MRREHVKLIVGAVLAGIILVLARAAGNASPTVLIALAVGTLFVLSPLIYRAITGEPLPRTTRTPPKLRRRPLIPRSVKTYVWQRDSGRCVECGSKERLEYDHIILVSKGGSHTERNLQLLCERCNRSKGASI